MEPINKADRRKTFTKFLLFFILTILIITTTIFFSIEVPYKQNDQLLTEMRTEARDQEFSESFMIDMQAIYAMVDSLGTTAQRPDLLDSKITTEIKRLNAKVEADSAFHKSMYRSVVFILNDLQTAKKQLLDFTGKSSDANDLRKQLETANNELMAVKSQNLTLQQLLNQQRH